MCLLQIGRDAEIMKDANTEWWHDAYSTGLKAVKSKKSKKRKSADTEATEGSRNAPTFEQLFAATGGARLGMRARASQKGKILRTEQAPQAPLSSNVSAANSVAITGAAQTKIIPKVKSSEENDPEAANEVKKEKKKKRKQDSLSEEMEEGGPASECVETSCVQDGQQSKKSKKERKSKEKSKDKR